jgi:hypothetical protein
MRVYWEEEMDWMATEAQADAEYARNTGYDRPEQAWILSDRDVWYPNPFYKGIPQPHPEDHPYEDESEMVQTGHGTIKNGVLTMNWNIALDDEIPF